MAKIVTRITEICFSNFQLWDFADELGVVLNMSANTLISVRNKLIMQSILIFLSFLFFDVFVFGDWLRKLYPLGDNFSLIVESKNSPLQWFFRGQANYFIPYPEFSVPFTNIIRPMQTALYFVFFSWTEFGFKLQQIVVNYGAHAAIAAVFYFFSVYILDNSRKYSLGLALAAFLAPAFWGSSMPFEPDNSLDGLAALFCLVAILCLVTRFPWIGFLFLFLGIFTKETALPIVAAVIVYSLLARRISFVVVAVLMVFAWAGLRIIAFGQLGGVYAFNDATISSLAYRVVTLFFLPVSYTTMADVKALVLDKIFSCSLFFYIVNAFMWILLIWLLESAYPIRDLIKKRFSMERASQRIHLLVMFSISVVFSAAFFVLIQGSTRFSYVFFVCFLGVLASLPDVRARAYIFVTLAVTSCAAALLSVGNLEITSVSAPPANPIARSTTTRLCGCASGCDPSQKAQYEMMYSASRGLVEELRKTGDLHRRVFVVNDFVGGSSREDNIAKFSGVGGEVFRGSSINLVNCKLGEVRGISTRVENVEGHDKTLVVNIPKCAQFQFEATSPRLILSNLDGTRLKRNSYISYDIPELVLGRSLIKGTEQVNDFGGTMFIRIKDAAVIYFDFINREWVYLP